jgi:CelD/BcsL family acetyltransferase involved in cellulose biosynthesis
VTVPNPPPPTQIPAGFQVRIFSSFEEPGPGATAWNDLVSRSDTNTVFQTFEWLTGWWEVFGPGRELLLIAVYHEQRLVGLAPLMRELSVGDRPVLAFVGQGNADYCDFLLAEPRQPALEVIVATLAKQRDQWQELRLANLPGQSFTATQIIKLTRRLGLLPLSCGRVECPTLVFGEPASAKTAIQRRQSLKRPWNYYQTHGHIEFDEISSLGEIHEQLESFFEQHVQRWQGTSTPSLFTTARNRQFYRELVNRLQPAGTLAFTRVRVNGKPLAFHFGFVHNQRYFWYKPSYAIEHRHHSPGTLMLRLLMLRALERGCKEFDFTIGHEAFKYRYSNTTRHNLCILVFPERPAYLLRRLGLTTRTWLKRLLSWRRKG